MSALYKILLCLSFLFISVVANSRTSYVKTNSDDTGDDNNKNAGNWELLSPNSGVSAMHSILLPNNKVVMYDATVWEISNIKLPAGTPCREVRKGVQDCWSHSVFFDIETRETTPLKLDSDTWCSSGALDVNGNLISTGGDKNGSWTVRFLDADSKSNWREYRYTLKDGRWYSTTVTLGDGRFVIFGGRDVYSYEFIPPEGQKSAGAIDFPFLRETRDVVENNLYPFVHLSTDGNLFIFANDRSVLFNITNNTIIREFPVLAGGARSYPSTGMSVLLPIKLKPGNQQQAIPEAEVLVCGGSTHDSFFLSENKQVYVEALCDCNRIRITDQNPQWFTEKMPSPRVMGDIILLPSGDVLMVNGARNGSAGWGDAKEPNLVPVLYKPRHYVARFRELKPTTIARMYHSSAALLPDGKVLIAGSNTNNGYLYTNVEFPTELRVEKFSPPYWDPYFDLIRPEIVVNQTTTKFSYGDELTVQIKLNAIKATKHELKVTMYPPSFATHGVTMNQRLIILGLKKVKKNFGQGTFDITVEAPPSGNIAPQGYYLMFAVYQGIPSKLATWVQIK